MVFPCGGFKKLSMTDDIVPESAFLFSCRCDAFGIAVAFVTWVMEFTVLAFFYQISDINHPNTAYVSFVPTCSEASSSDRRRLFEVESEDSVDSDHTVVCEDNHSASDRAMFTALAIVVLNIAPDLLGGLFLILRRRSVMHVITGLAKLSLAIMALFTSMVFVQASSQDDVAVYTNCVAVLFVLVCDEQVFYIVKMLFPNYVEETIQVVTAGDEATAIGLLNDVRFQELMERKNKAVTTTEITTPSKV